MYLTKPDPPGRTDLRLKSQSPTSAECATPSEIVELERLGFKVEDLGAEYGSSHQGAFRWVNIVAGEFQQDVQRHSEGEAWAAAKEVAFRSMRG